MRQALVVLAVLVGVFVLWGLRTAAAEGPEQVPSREDRVVKTMEEWRAKLSPEAFHVLREKGTERSFTSPLVEDHDPGVFVCAGCGLPLFDAKDKFESGTGWPSFTRPIAKDVVDEHQDFAYGMLRTEITCARCGGHLGHVFNDGPAPTGMRYCMNGVSLEKQASKDEKEKKDKKEKKTP